MTKSPGYNGELRPFSPIVSNPHLLTIAANYWPRSLDTRRFPIRDVLYRTEPEVQVLVREQRPEVPALGEIVLVHGLESSSEAPYMRSTAQAALQAGFAVHRFNIRSCGGTEDLCPTLYNAGLTSDLEAVLRELRRSGRTPIYLAGFSLGGNMVLKLAGELREGARGLIGAVCAVCTPIDLAAGARRLAEWQNRIYEYRFVRMMKQRLRRKHQSLPERFPLDGLDESRRLLDIDNLFTAPAFGFRDAADYYQHQSALRFLDGIRVPALLIQSLDDPIVPFEMFEREEVQRNPCIRLLSTRQGGHLGFLSRRQPRFWCDDVVVGWFVEVRANKHAAGDVLTW